MTPGRWIRQGGWLVATVAGPGLADTTEFPRDGGLLPWRFVAERPANVAAPEVEPGCTF
jgi:hypothetical protein